ncbi:gp53-like domain-containing protein [Pantoea agglomerans]|uniref:Uncharacterized protein n=1 Tax=Enterobacter agglomerans TaxID=549 RepID=A0ACC5RGU0_ENTAG|nr:hypothetical protein [Pantoea agglomerans]MBK4723895.1 hypothetical protein [Pantoea agglomerans]
MHRIDTPTAQVDKFGVGKNGFTAGNPQTGELPTALDQDFFDSVQEEISAVIEGASIQLNKASRNQLLTALKKLFLQPGNNLSEITNAAAALSKLGGAPLESPTFTGTPKGPTAAAGTSSTQLATTAFVQALIAGFLKTSNNLSEIAAAGVLAQLEARTSLGLGTISTKAVGTGATQVPDMSSFASGDGWMKFPNGKIIQYGYVVSGSTSHVDFPIPFPSKCSSITNGSGHSNNTAVAVQNFYNVTATGYDLRNQTVLNNPTAFYWQAIGE